MTDATPERIVGFTARPVPEPPEPPDDAPAPPEPPPEPPEDAPQTGQDAPDAPESHEGSPNREAARWRSRLRATEAERDALAERVTTMRRREAEQVASGSLSRPADLWLDGIEVGELLDDDGEVDAARVALAVKAVLDGRPQLAPKVADHGGGRRQSPASPASWADVIRSRKR